MPLMYRVVELQPTDDRRLRRVAPIWQPTLEMARQMAVAIERQSIAARIFIEDSRGNLIEMVRGQAAANMAPAQEASAGRGQDGLEDMFAANNWAPSP